MAQSKSVLVKMMGERNTGTNYLVKLLNSNLYIKFLRGTPTRTIHKLVKYNRFRQNIFFWFTYTYLLGWKHSGAPTGIFLKLAKLRNIHFSTLSKNPYSWLLSLYNKPYQDGLTYKTFQEFLNYKWPVSFMDNISNKNINPIELWNEKKIIYKAV